MTKFMRFNFRVDLSCLIDWYTPTENLKIHQLYEFVIYTSSQSGNESWQLMSKLIQFTDAHFPDPNRFLWQLKQHKVDLNVSTKSANFSTNNKGLSFSLQIRVITISSKSFALYFLNGTHLGIRRNESFARELGYW